MRISRSESPAPLPSLNSMEKLWALVAEREACLHGEDELMQSEKGVKQRDGWTSSKRLHIGGEPFCRRAIGEALTSNGVSMNCDPRLRKNDKHAGSGYDDSHSAMRHTERRKNRVRGFTSASRCYPPSVQAQCTDWFSRGTGAVKRVAHSSGTRQECITNGKRRSGFEMCVNENGQNELVRKTAEDHSLFDQDGLSEYGIRHSRKPSVRQSRARCSYGDKISSKGNRENEESPNWYKRASRKRISDAAAYDDAIRKRYDNAAAYNAVDSNAEDTNICGPHILESTRHKGLHIQGANQGVGEKEMIASSLLSEPENFDVNSDSKGPDIKSDYGNISEVPASMDINDHVVSPEKICVNKNKISRRQSVQRPSSTNASSVPRLSPAVFVDVTNRFDLHAAPGMKEDTQESDAHRLSQRQRQIEYGKNTLGYERYTELVPRLKRKARDPQTPNPKQVCSKRSWDGQIRKWRRLLHVYDPPSEDGEEIAEDLSALKLQRTHTPEIILDASATSTLPQRFCELSGNADINNFEGKMGMEDASLTIYDDWMEF